MGRLRVAVVGAGIAGLSAAYDLLQAGAEVTVLEAEPRAGGVIVTDHPAPGWVVEGGPDSVLAGDAAVPGLATELGIADRLIGQTARGSSVWNGAALRPLADGEAAKLLGIEASGPEIATGFRSFAGGMQELVDALVDRVGPAIRHRIRATSLRPAGGRGRYLIEANGEPAIEADAAVVAVPAYHAARLLAALDGDVARALDDIRYFPSLTVSLAYRRDQIGAALDGTGFVVQPGGGVDLNRLSRRVQHALFRLAALAGRFTSRIALRACTYSSSKFAGRAPAGHVLLRAFLLPVRNPAAIAHRGLARILGVAGEPLWARVFDWPRGLPRPGGDHPARIAGIRERLSRFPGLALAGAGYEAPSVSACVRSGRQAARSVLAAR